MRTFKLYSSLLGISLVVAQIANADTVINGQVLKKNDDSVFTEQANKLFQADPDAEMVIFRKKKAPSAVQTVQAATVQTAQASTAQQAIQKSESPALPKSEPALQKPEPAVEQELQLEEDTKQAERGAANEEIDQKIDSMAEALKTEVRNYLLKTVDQMEVSVTRTIKK